MASEIPIHHYNRLDRAVGTVGAHLVDRLLLRRVEYSGLEHIVEANSVLQTGSLMVVPDHANLTTTLYSANVMLMLEARRRAVVMTQAFESGQMGNAGRVAVRIVDHYGAEPIFVKTEKYVPDLATRREHNEHQEAVMQSFLKDEGNALLMYPEGTRQNEMGKAKKGFSRFAGDATAILPLTTVVEKGHRPRVIIHKPIPGKTGMARCVEMFGEEEGPRVFADLVMTIIATGQPNEKKRGVYNRMTTAIEQYLQNGIIPQEMPLQNVLHAYLSWKNGGFGV